MKNKISFTNVLKSKSSSRQLNLSSTESQNKHPRLIDIYQQFETNPDKNYTLELNFSRNIHRSRNSSIGMLRSNTANEDPEMNLESWIQKQKKQNFESFTKGPTQKSFKGALSIQQDNILNRRSKSNFNKNQMYHEQQECEEQQNYYQPQNMMIESKSYEQTRMEQSNKVTQRNAQKSPLHYRSQQNIEIQQQKFVKPKPQVQQPPSISPEQYFNSEQLQPKSHFPTLEDNDYKKLQQEFERLKNEKIAELCMQTKKSVKKQKLQQIISKALQNIHQDIQEMAYHIINQRKTQSMQAKKKISQEQVSEQMLISGSQYDNEENEVGRSEEQRQKFEEDRRQQEMRNMIKGYISGIQEAKSQGKSSTSFHESKGLQRHQSNSQMPSNLSSRVDVAEDQQQPSFNYHSNTFSNKIDNTFNNSKQNEIEAECYKKESTTKSSTPLDSVGYSFANSNMICQHSFSKQLMGHNNYQNQFTHGEQSHFQKNHVNPPVYEPQNSDTQEEQRISLPNIEQVKSDCGDFLQQQLEVESSQELQYRRNKMQNVTLDMTGKNIKNIESVHYEPPTQMYGYQPLESSNHRNNLFKHFEQNSFNSNAYQSKMSSSHSRNGSNFVQREQILREQNIHSHQEQKFVSKTFNSYLNGEMRPEYGQAVKDTPKETNESSFSSRQSGFGYKIEPIAKYSPSSNKVSHQKMSIDNKVSNQKKSFRSIASPREQNFTKMNGSINQQFSHSNMINSKLNESSQMSLNQSVNQASSRQQGVSPKNIHQLQSKTKFSINSPMNKIDEIISNEEKVKRQSQVTEFDGLKQKAYQFTKVPASSNSYAISSPVGDYKANNSFEKDNMLNSQKQPSDRKYACAESIVSNNPLKDQNVSSQQIENSILSMQPLKLSLQSSVNLQKSQMPFKQSQKFSNNVNHRVTQSRQDDQIASQAPKTQIIDKQIISSNISNGRTFLQSLHQKQSIEIELSPENKKDVAEQKASFVAQTFRPFQSTSIQSVSKPSASINENNHMVSQNKLSITKVTLRSSDRNQVTSPKVISLSINPLSQKTEPIKQFTPISAVEGKQNIFQKLTIKQSRNFENTNDKKTPSNQSISSTKTSQLSSIQHHHVDTSSKQNNNTMNNSLLNTDLKTQTLKGQPKSDNMLKQSSTSIQKTSAVITQKREPLLKLSKNFGNSTHQSINVKKSIGESIRTKVHPSPLASSKTIQIGGYGVKQSIRGVKQSIGNDSDMDFDLQLD